MVEQALASTLLQDPSAISGVPGVQSTGVQTVGNYQPPWLSQQQHNQSLQNYFFANSIANVGATEVDPRSNSTVGNKVGQVLGLADSGFKFLTGGSAGVSDAINSFGSSAFGFTNPALQGPTQTGAALGSVGSFTNSLGGQAFGVDGFLGSLGGSGINSIANGFMNTGASFLGSIASSAIFGNSQGSQIGGTIGGMIGSYFGPVGAFAGNFLGSALGSLFGGGGTPHPWSMFRNATVDPTGKILNATITNKHIGKQYGTQTQSSLEQYLQNQATKYGIQYKEGLSLYGGYRDKKGHLGITSTPNFWTSPEYKSYYSASYARKNQPSDTHYWSSYDAQDNKARQDAYKAAFEFAAKYSGYDPTTLAEQYEAGKQVKIPVSTTPSKWQEWLADYRQKNPATTPQTIPTPSPQG